MLSDYNGIKQEINTWRINAESPNILRVNSILLNCTLVKDDVTGGILKYFEFNKKIKIHLIKTCGMQWKKR